MALYSGLHPRGGSIDVFVQNSNESLALVFVAMAQTVPVLTGGLDLSVGAVMTMVDCVASTLVSGSAGAIALGIVASLAVGALAGLVNGCIVVYGRIQPIIATLATGAIYMGVSLFLRPTPGGTVDSDLSWVATNALSEMDTTYGWFPNGAPGWFADGVGPDTDADPAAGAGHRARLAAVPPHRDGSRMLRCRLVRAGRLHVRPAGRAAASSSPTRSADSSPAAAVSISRCRPAAATPTSSRPVPTP